MRLDLPKGFPQIELDDWARASELLPPAAARPSKPKAGAQRFTVGDKVEAAYRRGDGFQKRLLLAEEWATYCGEAKDGPAEAEGTPKVVSLRRQRAKAA